jgi:hypothetical protein
MDISEYRRQYAEQLDRAAHEHADARRAILGRPEESIFKSRLELDRVDSPAVPPSGEPDEPAEFLAVVQDRDADAQRRIEALDAMSNAVGESHELIDAVIALLLDASEPATLRLAAMRVLQQTTFQVAVFAPKRPDYLAALRAVAGDPDAGLREEALEILSLERDEYAQRMLLEGLLDPAKARVSPEKAIEFLGFDVHAEHFPILREVVQNPPSAEARQEAVRLLSADPGSRELLGALLEDRGEEAKVRTTSAQALQSLDPDEFERRARRIVLDDDEDDDLRATLLGGLAHVAGAEAIRTDHEFSLHVEMLSESAASEALARTAARFVSRQREA